MSFTAPKNPGTRLQRAVPSLLIAILLTGCVPPVSSHSSTPSIVVDQKSIGFVLQGSQTPFHPWGNNYGNHGRLLEDFWATDWPTVERDFAEMKLMGANVVRVHLQFGKFMRSAEKPNSAALRRLQRLLRLAQKNGLYLDLTGLACYRKEDVPAWYDALPESKRWEAQARFWECVARTGRSSPAVFCYDLINEPVVAGEKRSEGEWYTGKFGDYYFLQFLNLDLAGRTREDIARQWTEQMTRAIHRQDPSHLITVGMLPPTPSGGEFSGFALKSISPLLDFLSVHIYPEDGKVNEGVAMLRHENIGKPVVVEETFPLTCSKATLEEFMRDGRSYAAGWIGHYNGETLADLSTLRQAGTITAAQTRWLEWLELFQELGSNFRATP